MADSQGDESIAPRRSLKPILPPPPPGMGDEKEREQAKASRTKEASRKTRAKAAPAHKPAEHRAAASEAEPEKEQVSRREPKRPETGETTQSAPASAGAPGAPAPTTSDSTTPTQKRRPQPRQRSGAPHRTRRAQLRLVQVDAWSVMKTSFLLSIALGIVLVVAVAIIWTVLGAAGVWESINSIVQQAVGTNDGTAFDIEEYAGISRVLGFTMIVAVVDVILITAIATLGAFLYNLAAALLGGIEVTLAEDS